MLWIGANWNGPEWVDERFCRSFPKLIQDPRRLHNHSKQVPLAESIIGHDIDTIGYIERWMSAIETIATHELYHIVWATAIVILLVAHRSTGKIGKFIFK